VRLEDVFIKGVDACSDAGDAIGPKLIITIEGWVDRE
jgi:hypothetical protein